VNYLPLNIKTCNTLLGSMIKIDELIKTAKEAGLKALTITDNNMYGVLEFYLACKKNDIKPVVGIEIKLPETIILYCKNYNGYKNLMKLTTIMSEKELTIDEIKQFSKDIICIIPYQSRQRYNELKNIYEDIFVSYKNKEENDKIRITNKVYMKEILCLNKDDEQYLKYLKAIKEGKLATEINDEYQNVSLLPVQNLNLENNNKILNMCNLEIKTNQNLLPLYPCENSYELLKKKCIEGMRNIFGSSAKKIYAERLKKELNVINQMNFCDYFLIVADYINYAKKNKILVGPGRGSAAGSLVAYCLEITTIDPIKYDLLFERFLNKERITMPDIDVDFEDSRREEVINYCVEKYGDKKVALIITFGTLAAKQAIKDVCRVLNIDNKKADILSKKLDSKKSLKENYNPKIKQYLDINPELKRAYKIASKFEGLKRHTSLHAAGIVMSKYNLDECLPLTKTHDNNYATQYDKDYLEQIGLLKMDFLGLKNLTLITNILKDIKNLEFDDIKEDDIDALNIFKEANTVGIFQFESQGMIDFIRKFKPKTFEDIVSALALYRPGPMRNIDSYIRRKQGKEKIDYLHEDLEKILKPTYGIIVYQEQIMQIANVMAGYTLAEADLLRRAMSKKKESILLKEKDKFISQSVKRGYDINIATKVYNLIFTFANYGFNKSHSVAYATIAYKMAYLKAHYPKIFMKNLLSSAINSETKTKDYIYECKKNKIQIKSPDINISGINYQIDGNEIIFPLTNIKNVGVNAVNIILENRKHGKFKDIFDFVCRCYGKAVNKKTLENLILAGCFDNLGLNKQTLINNLEIIINYGEIGSYLDDEMFKPQLENKTEYSKQTLMNYELEVFGFYLSNHPVTEYKLKYKNNIDLININDYFDKNIETIVYIEKTKQIQTKQNQPMMFMTGSDESAKVDIVVFPKILNNFRWIEKGNIVRLKGKVEKRYDEMQIIANNLEKLE